MTIEMRYLIGLADILAIEFQCRVCGAKTLLNVEGVRVITDCPICRETWMFPDTPEERVLRTFIKSLEALKTVTDGRRFALKVQVAEPTKPLASQMSTDQR